MENLDTFTSDKTTITLNCSRWRHTVWTCEINREDQGIRLCVTGEGLTSMEAVSEAVYKFQKALGGVPELQPALEYQPARLHDLDEPVNLNDGVQF